MNERKSLRKEVEGQEEHMEKQVVESKDLIHDVSSEMSMMK